MSKSYVKCLNFKLYYQQLHLKYLCNLASYWLQDPWGWYDSVETCRSVIIREIILHLLVIIQNNKRWKIHVLKSVYTFNPLKPELNPICYLLALLGAHYFLHVSRIRVKLLIFRLLMSYIYGAPILDVSRSHTTTQHSR